MNSDLSARTGLLLCIGAMCLLPPIALIFNKPIMIFGIPLVVMYVFGAWLTLIILAKLLSGKPTDNGSQ